MSTARVTRTLFRRNLERPRSLIWMERCFGPRWAGGARPDPGGKPSRSRESRAVSVFRPSAGSEAALSGTLELDVASQRRASDLNGSGDDVFLVLFMFLL